MVRFILLVGVLIAAFPLRAETDKLIVQPGEPFVDYVNRSRAFLLERKVWVNEAQKERELAAVMPFEYLPDENVCSQENSTGILLSHGLSDSPFSMRDVAQALQESCVRVRVILLAGHGTQGKDLIPVTRKDWQTSFEHAADQFATEVDRLYVGGFSTGGALAADYAWHSDTSVSGVVLFSPLLKINSGIDWLSPWLAPFITWLDQHPDDDFAKYASIPVPAIKEAYLLAKETKTLLLETKAQVPVFIALSYEDKTVDSQVTLDVFQQVMGDNSNQMVLYSRRPVDGLADNIHVHLTDWPEQQILGLSHMAIQGSPDNPYYGADGEYRVCGWYASEPALYEACRSQPNNWYGEKSADLLENSEHAGRISWNPMFSKLMSDVRSFMQVNDIQ
ncbi:alpha/beta hydrolase [Marinomonas epiphytica]